MAARGESLLKIDSVTITPGAGSPVTVKGVNDCWAEEFVLLDLSQPTDGAYLPASDDCIMVTSWRIFVAADVLADILTSVATGAICTVAVVGALFGGTNTKLNLSITKMRAGPIGRMAIPGGAGTGARRIAIGRTFEPCSDSVVTGPTEAA